MKIKDDIRTITTTQQNISKAIGVTPERIRQMIHEGIVIRDEKDNSGGIYVFETVKRYYSRENAEKLEINYDYEHARLEQVKRELAELKLEQAKGRLYEAGVVEQVITTDLVKIRTQLLSLPIKLSVELEGKTREQINDILTREIESALMEMTEYEVEKFKVDEEP